jgi:ABC-type nitrate/sulfonate/bicarbonate transport system substrate-binding protein|tara:strand:- start:1865 stop:2188 length:324 start_codon:yes stop_codon:yes gene_type:complete
MITEERVEKSLIFIAESDEEAAKAFAKVKGLEKDEKIVKALGMTDARRMHNTIADADAAVYRSASYVDWRERYENSIADSKLLENKRDTERIIWETWRTEQANIRRS